MAPVVPDPERIRSFADMAHFEAWLSAHHDTDSEIWIRIHKKHSAIPSMTYGQALDVALCWGWIDGLKKTYDADTYLQRFSPRRPKSVWSQVNRTHVARLIAQGRMTPFGQRHVDAAKADGRWDAAYAPGSAMQMPDDLVAAIAACAPAQATFETLNRQNLYALAFRLGPLRTQAGRDKKIADFVAMLARGETLYPNGKALPRTAGT